MGGSANTRARGDGGGKPHLSKSVVDGHCHRVNLDQLGQEDGEQRKGKEAVGDSSAERTPLRSLDVDVNPLPVAGSFGEKVDATLIDDGSLAGAQVRVPAAPTSSSSPLKTFIARLPSLFF